MRRGEEFSESLGKLNNRLTILEDCVRMLEQRVAAVEDMNRLNEKKVSQNLQELYTYRNDIKDLKTALNSFTGDITSESSNNRSQ